MRCSSSRQSEQKILGCQGVNNIKDKMIFDKIQFLFHRLILGVIYWIIVSFFVSYQQYLIKHSDNAWTLLVLYLVPLMVFLWFMRVSCEKNQWKPFGKHSDIIGFIISFIGCLIPFLAFPCVIIVQLLP
ncbi:hypothetical protein DesyoDRAFT_3534 [Desulfosporosinus youngiae DSM 17734]|uniref:Uncharacterized protein n=1 Tax=Desulfosporosinus youngiae DSM 17734 TaxID=768710 RepID=H5XWN1_9FIRM|nr:hypothetical protein DesyoDRAFT_3534 [Desulfosporosinus youngiae DSM 17734]